MNIAEEENAIVCREVCKTFGSKKSAYQVLHGVTITVPKGTIYALLGPSGSGKTTLLKCILGRLSIDEGSILVYDQPPHNKTDANRPKIGYMPQDISLTEELTVDETLRFFGKISKMNSSQIEEKRQFLLKFLEMPFHKREIRTLSGGQKRRVSFAVALIHEPEILILDEPTVGVDPPLRKSIWEYLYTIAEKKNVTIIVTTHYIEEAHMANSVGLMFNGSMVAEDKPDILVEQHGCQNLENVFLKLCQQRENELIQNSKIEDIKQIDGIEDDKSMKSERDDSAKYGKGKSQSGSFHRYNFQRPNSQRMCALFMKDLWLILRNPGLMLVTFGIPSITMLLFALTIGKPITGLPFGIVNHDRMNYSTLYLQSIDSNLINQVHYNIYDEAFKDAKNGKLWGVLYLNANFTNATEERYTTSPLVDDVSLENSLISVAMDLSNKNMEIVIHIELQKSYRRFLKAVFQELGLNAMSADFPVKFEPRQVHGSIDSSYADYLFPSFMMELTFYVAMCVAALTLVVANEAGHLDRLYISGVDFLEVAFAQIFSQLLIMVSQCTLLFITVFGILRFGCAGSYILAFLMCTCQGFCGITLGILISSIVDTQTMTIVVCVACFLVGTVMNTSIWPIEGTTYALKIVTLMSPQFYAFDAFRSIVIRGWGLTYRTVIAGFTVSIVWSPIFILLAIIVFRLKS